MSPSLTIMDLVTSGSAAAAQLQETLTVDGVERSFPIAVFLRFDGDRISHAKVYREGSADLD